MKFRIEQFYVEVQAELLLDQTNRTINGNLSFHVCCDCKCKIFARDPFGDRKPQPARYSDIQQCTGTITYLQAMHEKLIRRNPFEGTL